jgi:hypothetical protein
VDNRLPQIERLACATLLPMTVTMPNIAQRFKVPVVTVSKVLRNQGNICTKTRGQVLKKAQEFNHQTDWIAYNLAMRKTFRKGPPVPDFTHPFFAEIAKSVAETANLRTPIFRGVEFMVSSSDWMSGRGATTWEQEKPHETRGLWSRSKRWRNILG